MITRNAFRPATTPVPHARKRAALMVSAAAVALIAIPGSAAFAQAPGPNVLPQDPNVVAGGATFGGTSPTLDVNQSTSRVVIDWRTFDIGSDATVNFYQPDTSSIAVNRVSGGGDSSQIYGTLNANGTVVILNPNGVLFSASSRVDVGGLIASTGDLDVTGFMADNQRLDFTGATSGTIVTAGQINIAGVGLGAFVAPSVRNDGTITATGGRVMLGAGEAFTLDLASDGLLELTVPTASPLVENFGAIMAQGGRIQLSAAAASAVVGNVINTTGVLQVGSAIESDGVIVLNAVNGDAAIGGTVQGGDVTVSANRIQGTGQVNTGGALTLNVNQGSIADTTTGGTNWIADALGVIGTVNSGSTINLGTGLYAAGALINRANVTLNGGGLARISATQNGEDGIVVGSGGDGAVITGLEIFGQADQAYNTFAWGGTITRGVRVMNGAENVTVTGNNIHDVRNGILIDGRNDGSSITGNVIDNTKSGISVQYTDGSNLTITGNSEGAFGNEWGINVHLNGVWDGITVNSGNGELGANPTLAAQQHLLTLSDANSGMSVYNQAFTAANRTHVNVGTGGSPTAQGSLATPISTIQGGINAVVSGGTVSVRGGTYAETVSINRGLTLAGAGMDATSITGGMVLTGTINDLNLSGFSVTGTGAGNAVIRGSGASVTNLTMDQVRVDAGSVAGRSGISGGHYGGDISITNSEFLNINHWVVFDTRSGAGGPGAGTNISSFLFADNLIDNVKGGITVRQNDGGTGSVTISGNTVQNIGDSTWSSGGIFKIFNAGTVDFTGNTISDIGTNASLTADGVAYGAALLMRGVNTLNVADNTFTNVHMAVATEKNGYSAPTQTTFTGNTFTNTGYAFFMPSDALTGGNVVFGAGNAIVSGADTVQHIVWRGGSVLDLTGVTFDGQLGSEMSVADLLALEDLITHGTDVAGAGLAVVNAGNVYVTQNSGSIQRGINAANAGFTVNIGDGTYNENVLISTAGVTLRSVNQYGAIVDAGGTGVGIQVSSAHGALGTVTIDGFTVRNWNSGGIVQGMSAAPFATTHVRNNNVIGPVGGSTSHGNGIQVSGDGSTVTGNTVSGAILNSADWSGSGILVVNGSNILVSGNQVSGSDIGIGVMNWNAADVSGVTIDNNVVTGHSEGISIQVYGGPISGVAITNNTISGNDSGIGVWDWGLGANSWTGTVASVQGNTLSDNQTHISSDFADAGVVSLLGANTFDRTIHATGGSTIYGDLSFAVSDAAAGSDLILSGDTFVEDDQILIDRNLTLTGQTGTVVQAGRNFIGTAPANAWWLVGEGVTFGLSNLAVDGAGFSITHGLRNHGSTTVDNVAFSNIVHGAYGGIAIGSFGGTVAGGSGAGTWANSSLTVTNSSFSNIGRIGVLVKGTGATADIIGNTFTGKGDGNWLDYAVEVGASGTATIIGNTITGNTGVALSDGSTSAGILVTSYYGGASTASIQGNTITGNGTGIFVGYNAADVSSVFARGNDLSGNLQGMALTSATATADGSGNWWGTADDALILAYMGGAEGGSIDFSTYLTSGVDTDGATGFQGDFSDITVTALGGQTGTGSRIQEGLGLVNDAGTVRVGSGTFTQGSTLVVDRAVTLTGAGRDATFINAAGVSGYGINVRTGGVELANFTLTGPAADAGSSYGIKVSPGGGRTAVLDGFTINNVTVRGSGRAELDLNGVRNAVIDGFIADGQGTKGAGIQVTDSNGVVIRNSTTFNNAWGGVALYLANRSYDLQLGNILIEANNDFQETNSLFFQGYSPIHDEPGPLTIEGYSHIVQNDQFRAADGHWVYFQKTLQGALDFAVNLSPSQSDASIVGGWTGTDFDGTFTVGIGNLTAGGTQAMSIGAAANAAETGNTVRVLAGTYSGFGTAFGGESGVNILGDAGAVIDGTGVTGRIVDLRADGTVFSGFTITGDGGGVGVSISGRGVTASDNTISNVLTGIQTTTQYAAGDAVITGNTISANYGVSLQNTGNTVAGNTVNAAIEGVGLLQGANSFSGNTFTMGVGGDALALYWTASAADMTGGDNTVTIAGGNLQGAVDLALGNGTVNVGDGTYAENVLVSGVRTLRFGDVSVNGLTLAAGAAGSGLSGDVASTGDLAFVGDVTLLGDLNLSAAGSADVASIAGSGHNLSLAGTSVSLGSVGNLVGLDITGATTLAGGSYAADQITVAGATTLTRDTTIGGSSITLGSVSGAHSLGLTGSGAVALGAADLASLTANGATINTAGVTTTGGQSYTGATTLNGAYSGTTFNVAGATTLGGATTIGGSSITLGSVSGAHSLGLTGTGSVALGAADLASLTANGATINTAGVTTTGGQSYTGATTLNGAYSGTTFNVAGATTLGGATTIGGSSITLGSVSGAHSLGLTGSGAVALGAADLASLTANGATINTAGVTTTGGQSYTGATTLNGAYSGTTFNVAGATTLGGATNVTGTAITLGTVDGNQALTINGGTGPVSLGALGSTTTLASANISGGSLDINGARTARAQTYTGAAITASGQYATAGGAYTLAGSTTLDGATTVSTQGGAVTTGDVNGAAAGAQSLSIDAGTGTTSLGALGSTVRLGAVLVRANTTALNGATYAGNSLAFQGTGTNANVRLTRVMTTFNTTSGTSAGTIAIGPNLIGTAAGAQSVAFIAGPGTGADSANGDITLGNLGSDAIRLGSMSVTGSDLIAQTVKLAGDYNSVLTGNQTFSAQTLDTLGNANMRVAGNDTGPIVAGGSVTIASGGSTTGSLTAGGPVNVTSGGSTNRVISSGGTTTVASQGTIGGSVVSSGPVVLTATGPIVSSVTTPGSVNITSNDTVTVNVQAGSVNLTAPGGTIGGTFGTISTGSSGTFNVNGEVVVGDGTATDRQILVDTFLAPAGGVVGSTGQIQLPVNFALALIAPAGDGSGTARQPIIVNSIDRLGELLRLGYTAIIIQIDGEEEYEQELNLAAEGTQQPQV